MSDRSEEGGADREKSNAPRPPSVRDQMPPPAPAAAETKKPTPVRAMAAAEAPPPPVEPDVDRVEVEIGDEEWVVGVLGRSGGSAPSATPLVLLGFWRPDDTEGDPVRESLVVGRALQELTPEQLSTAFARSEAPRERPTAPPPAAPKGRGRKGPRRRGRG